MNGGRWDSGVLVRINMCGCAMDVNKGKRTDVLVAFVSLFCLFVRVAVTRVVVVFRQKTVQPLVHNWTRVTSQPVRLSDPGKVEPASVKDPDFVFDETSAHLVVYS